MRFVLAIVLMFSIFNSFAKPIKPAAEWLPKYLESQQISIDVISSITFNQSDISSQNSSLLVMPYSPPPHNAELVNSKSSIFIGEVNESKANDVYQLSCNIDGVGDENIKTIGSSLPIVKRYIEKLPKKINKDTAICGLKALLWLDENNQKPSLTVFKNLSNVYHVLRAVAPQNGINAYKLITNENPKTELIFIEPSLANISHVNALLNNKISSHEVSDYSEIFSSGEQEYRASLTAYQREKLDKQSYLEKVLKRYEKEIIFSDKSNPEAVKQDALTFMIEDRMDSYANILEKINTYTLGDEVRGVNKFQTWVPQSILRWEKFGGAYKVVYDGVKIDQTLVTLNKQIGEREKQIGERKKQIGETKKRIGELKKRIDKSTAEIKAGIILLRRLGREDLAIKFEKLLEKHQF